MAKRPDGKVMDNPHGRPRSYAARNAASLARTAPPQRVPSTAEG